MPLQNPNHLCQVEKSLYKELSRHLLEGIAQTNKTTPSVRLMAILLFYRNSALFVGQLKVPIPRSGKDCLTGEM